MNTIGIVTQLLIIMSLILVFAWKETFGRA